MNTTIIECSKSSAVVSNSNRWTSKIQGGKMVKEGDLLSVEGIAINSLGVGGDIVEIPPEINPPVQAQSGVGTYASNKQSIVVAHYVHHNFQKTCSMPIRGFTARRISDGANVLVLSGQLIDNLQNNLPDVENIFYGSLLGGYDNTCQFNCENVLVYPESLTHTSKYNGSRFYFIGKKPNESNGDLGWRNTTEFLQPPYSSNKIWDYYKTELRFGVDIGYDSPQNIATRINDNINQTLLATYNKVSTTGGSADYEIAENIVYGGVRQQNETQTTKQAIISLPVNNNNQKQYIQGSTTTSQPDLITPQPDLVVPQPDLVTPQPDLVTPQPDLITPQPDLIVPQPDIYTPPVPAVPAQVINRNNTNSGTTTLLTTTYDYNNSPANIVLGNSYETMADDGGLSSDYTTSHSRCITYDAGSGNKIMINPVNFTTEHSTYAMYDRIGITCSNTISGLSTSSGNLSSADSTLSQYLYQSSSSSPSTFWGQSWTASNGGYGTGGGWIFPSSSGTDSKGNNNSSWVNTWYVIDARYIKIYFKSDGSATEPGWEFRIARQENVPGTPAIPGFYTPQPDLVVPQPDLVTPQPDLITPQPDLVTPQPDLIVPQPDLVTPQPDIVVMADAEQPAQNENVNYFGLAVVHPERILSGYNLLSFDSAKVGLSNLNIGIGDPTQSSPGMIYCCNNPTQAGGFFAPVVGEIIVTNLFFNSTNLGRMKRHLTAPYNLEYDTTSSNIELPDLNLDNILNDKKAFYSFLDVGRINDNKTQAPVAGLQSFVKTNPNPAPALQNTPAHPVDFANAGQKSRFAVYTYYDEVKYDALVTPTPIDETPGSVNKFLSYKIIDKWTSPGGVIYDFKKMAEAYNVMLVAIEVTGSLTQYGSPAFSDSPPVIGVCCAQPFQPPDCRPISYADYCVFDPGFMRMGNQSVKMRSPRLRGNDVPPPFETPPVEPPVPAADTPRLEYSQVLQVGAPNPTFTFNETLARFAWSNLEWGYYIGNENGTEAVKKGGVAQAGQTIISYNAQSNPPSQYSDVEPDQLGNGDSDISFRYATCGIGVVGYKLYNETTGIWENIEDKKIYELTDIDPISINQSASKWWENSVLERIGFDYEDLFPKTGYAYELFQTSTFNQVNPLLLQEPTPTSGIPVPIIPEMWKGGVKPFTTNAYISTALSLSYSVNDYGQPNYDQEYQRGIGYGNITYRNPAPGSAADKVNSINVDSQSAFHYAKRLPRKLTYPYWLVYSDLIGANFLGNDGQPANIMAIANRAYTSGDFAFNFATDYTFVARKDFVISQITTEILNPDYSKAQIDDGTIILYKIQHPIAEDEEQGNEKTGRAVSRRGHMINTIGH
tara:strand:+ start:17028 stop:21041 length:4014 start_codon:yes stop_codon:yes gene_type:complete